ncbi:MAG: ferrochelatase, partial [Caulobacteraceae bacterium]
QYSTTTTASSLEAWNKAYKGSGQVHEVCCYPRLPGLIDAHARLIKAALDSAEGKVRVLFSAHGLPERVIKAGDPYQRQIEATAAAIIARLDQPVDWQVCYQSRVGRLVWIGPSTPEAIEQAARDEVGVVVLPIAFVSEHIETLVELDHEYAELAENLGCAPYIRVPALGVDRAFIAALADITVAALDQPGVAPGAGWTCGECGPICPARDRANSGGVAAA